MGNHIRLKILSENQFSRKSNFYTLVFIQGNVECVRLLLSHPEVNVNDKDRYDKTGLIWATKFGYTKVVELLLEQPTIDVNAMDGDGYSALHWAALERYGDKDKEWSDLINLK